jgi:transposase
MRKRGSNKEAEVDAMIHALTAWKFKTQGLSFPEIAARMDVSLKTVRRYIDRILPAASTFPTELTPAEINKQRQLESEILHSARSKVIRQMEKVEADSEISASDKLQALSAGLKALSMATARLAAMNALNAPTEIREQSVRLLQVNLTRSGDKPMLTWDRSILTEPVRHVEGLTIYEGCRNNGDTTKQLPDTASN